MGEIDLDKMEIRLVDTDWLEGEMLAHELAHFERYKEENTINKLSGHFGDFVLWTIVILGSAFFLNWLGILNSPLYGSILVSALAVFGIGIIAKGIEEHKVENMISEMKKKYDLGVGNDESG